MKRDDMESAYKWNLEDIFRTEQEWEREYKDTFNQLSNYELFENKTISSAQTLLDCLSLDEKVSLSIERLYVYAAMKRDQDTANTHFQGMIGRAESLSVQISSASSFIVPELLQLSISDFDNYCKEVEELSAYRMMFLAIVKNAPHILSSDQEELLSEMGSIASAPSGIYNMLNNADIKFPEIENENGELVELTKSNYAEFMESENRTLRENAFRTLYAVYIKQRNTIAATLYANIKKNVFYAKVRKHPSALEKSLFADDVPLEVYENLIKTVKQNLTPMDNYLKIKQKALGLDELHAFDLSTPLVPESNDKITYDEAYSTMKRGLSVLGQEYIDMLETARQEGWIDVYENEGKRGGAYSWGAYGTHPYVLLNHKDNLNSMFTLAHEMGHAMHSYYSDEANPYLYAGYTIFVAEVASTVNEVLLMNHLLKESTNKETKKYLLNYFLEQFRGTIYRQTMFAEFEMLTHRAVENGETLTVDRFDEIYSDLSQDYYGNVLVHDEEVKSEWMRIPHFYNAFYVYKYATGFSAAIAIAKAITTEGEPAVKRYMQFLKSGGTDYPIELLKKAGVDMSKPAPIEDALAYFAELVEELAALE